MKVVIFGATGMVGSQLVTHCLAKKWDVLAFGRNIQNLMTFAEREPHLSVMKGYIFDDAEVGDAIYNADYVLSALGGSLNGQDKARSLGVKHIVSQMTKHGVKRIVAVGGTGILPDESGRYLFEDKDYDPTYVPVSKEHAQAYEHLKNSDLEWTMVCPPYILDKPADNQYEAVAEQMGPSMEINAGNLALFMVQELGRKEFVRQRVGIGNS